MERDRQRGVKEPVQRTNWTTIVLIGALILLALIVAYFVTRGNPDQDKLTNAAASFASSAQTASDKMCASKSTYDLIKRDLFRRAAQVRGSDQAAYEQLSTVAVLRMENSVMESEDSSTGSVNCSGSLFLDLPPNVAVVGGRHTLTADIDYGVQPAADGTGPVVLLRNADAIVTPLATLSRTAQPHQEPTMAPVREGESVAATTGAVPPATPSLEATPGAASSRPTFDCGRRKLAAKSRYARMPDWPRSIATWPLNFRALWLRQHLTNRCFYVARVTVSSAIATDAPTIAASATLMWAGCVRSRTSWRAAGSRQDKWWISNGDFLVVGATNAP